MIVSSAAHKSGGERVVFEQDVPSRPTLVSAVTNDSVVLKCLAGSTLDLTDGARDASKPGPAIAISPVLKHLRSSGQRPGPWQRAPAAAERPPRSCLLALAVAAVAAVAATSAGELSMKYYDATQFKLLGNKLGCAIEVCAWTSSLDITRRGLEPSTDGCLKRLRLLVPPPPRAALSPPQRCR